MTWGGEGCAGFAAISSRVYMQIEILKSKIHRATVTAASLDYEGSLSVDSALMEQAGLFPYEKVLCSNLANGERFETYLISARSGAKAIVSNGATPHPGKIADRLTLMSDTLPD